MAANALPPSDNVTVSQGSTWAHRAKLSSSQGALKPREPSSHQSEPLEGVSQGTEMLWEEAGPLRSDGESANKDPVRDTGNWGAW